MTVLFPLLFSLLNFLARARLLLSFLMFIWQPLLMVCKPSLVIMKLFIVTLLMRGGRRRITVRGDPFRQTVRWRRLTG